MSVVVDDPAAVAAAEGPAGATGLRLSVVVPTFNESGNVRELCDRLSRTLGPDGWEVVFVDDDSPDGTAQAVRALARADRRVRCLQRLGRRGLSSACIEGMMAAAAPYVAVMDADLQHDESILPRMLAAAEGGAEVVVASRYMSGGGTGDWDESRRQMSRLATRIGHAVVKTRTTDPMSGFFLLDRRVIESTARGLSGIGFKILLDVLATARRPLRVAEVPYTFRNRLHGESKLDENVLWEYGMLLADKTVGRYVPVRFLSFSIIGGLGVIVHMVVLSMLLWLTTIGFQSAQIASTVVAMVFNFGLNNVLTYRDRRLRGFAWLRGLVIFMLACSIGAVANVGVANALFAEQRGWVLAAFAGVMISAVWNYAVTRLYTWNKRGK